MDTFRPFWTLFQKHSFQPSSTLKSKVNHEKFNNANKWLQTLYNRKSQWAARWTWGHLTMGAHSTQRSEAVNSSIKHFLNTHTLLTELVTKEEYRETITDQSEGKATKIMLKHASQTTGVHPIETSLRNVISPFALTLVKGQVTMYLIYNR